MNSAPKPRSMRADAVQNRAQILKVAGEVIAELGTAMTLDEVVKRSGLGVGTLYRHFPTRDELIAAVYLSEVEHLGLRQVELSREHSPLEALRTWMYEFVDFLGAKQVMKETLKATSLDHEPIVAESVAIMEGCINRLASAAIAEGSIVLTMEPVDLLRAVAGVVYVGSGPEWAKSTRNVVDLILVGIQTSSRER